MEFIAFGRRSLMFFSANLRGESGGTAAGAFANEMSVPFLLESLKLLLNLDTKVSKLSTERLRKKKRTYPFQHRQIRHQRRRHS